MGQCTDVGWEFPPTNNFTGTKAKANAIQIYRKPILIFDPRKRRRKEEVLFTLTHTMIANWHIRSTTCLLQSIMAIFYWPTECVQWCVSCPCCVALHWRKCSRYTEYISLVNRVQSHGKNGPKFLKMIQLHCLLCPIVPQSHKIS